MPQGTPMMQQYQKVKQEHDDCLLFFRLGDFYEMFDEDASVASKELDLVLTTRDRSAPKEEQTPMCGVPAHSVEGYVARLIAKGYKVAICEQMEDPKLAKGLVEREVIRIITPGTATMSGALDDSKNNFLGAAVVAGNSAGVAICDFSTGEFYATTLTSKTKAGLLDEIRNEISRYSPSEMLVRSDDRVFREWLRGTTGSLITESDISRDDARRACRDKFPTDSASIEDSPAEEAAGMLVDYLYATQKTDLGHIKSLSAYLANSYMELDPTARKNLELTASMQSGEKKGSLLWVLDRTRTPMGARLMRSWIERPLIDAARITRRHESVGELVENAQLRDEIRGELRGMGDVERLIGRISANTGSARELRALADALRHMAPLKALLGEASSPLIQVLGEEIDPLDDLIARVDEAIVDEPPLSVGDGGMIRAGFDGEVDRLRGIQSGGKTAVASIEEREKERTGIKTLKVGYNRVFGYYIEVRRSAGDRLPDGYIRKQTLVDRERYITEELKNLESEILTASDRLSALEYELFCKLRAEVSDMAARVQRSAKAAASADVLASFAEVASTESYCRPTVDTSDRISIRDGRHPVVEKMQDGVLFVPNDLELDCSANTVAIITGPNMAGKSTYMRQAALMVIMAQAGSFVPARKAEIGVCDRVFTRIGASDDLSSGRSTFMVEMSEVAEILKHATRRSLLILDEIGRGTSTYDGMAIARAVLEWVCDREKLGAKTLFATHYHELTVMEEELSGVKNYNIAVKKRGDEIVFLRKIVRGGADDSYGVEVAKLAGLPDGLISRAHELLEAIEREVRLPSTAGGTNEPDEQMGLGELGAGELARELASVDPNALSPYEAWQKLAQYVQKAKELG